MHVVRHQMAFFNPALLLLGEAPEYLAQMLPKLLVQRFATAFGNENHVVFALPPFLLLSSRVWHTGQFSNPMFQPLRALEVHLERELDDAIVSNRADRATGVQRSHQKFEDA